MPSLVLDASAALRIVLDAERHPSLLDRVESAEAVYAPSLFVSETANALWKYVGAGHLSEEDALRLHRDAVALVDRLVADVDLFPEALTVASRQKHPVYDALCVVVARRNGAALMTMDKRLLALARRLDIALAE